MQDFQTNLKEVKKLIEKSGLIEGVRVEMTFSKKTIFNSLNYDFHAVNGLVFH